MKLDVILTCYNRAEKTRMCIERLQSSASKSKYDVRLQFFVCNDGSTDNTSEILREFGESVFEITGNGKLFWAKGMAAALKAAESTEKDYYLMVNDDVLFEPNAIDILFDNYGKYTEKNPVIVGATKDDRDDSFTYGGYIWNGKALLNGSRFQKANIIEMFFIQYEVFENYVKHYFEVCALFYQRFRARSIARRSSRSLILSRLSYCFLPLAMAMTILA